MHLHCWTSVALDDILAALRKDRGFEMLKAKFLEVHNASCRGNCRIWYHLIEYLPDAATRRELSKPPLESKTERNKSWRSSIQTIKRLSQKLKDSDVPFLLYQLSSEMQCNTDAHGQALEDLQHVPWYQEQILGCRYEPQKSFPSPFKRLIDRVAVDSALQLGGKRHSSMILSAAGTASTASAPGLFKRRRIALGSFASRKPCDTRVNIDSVPLYQKYLEVSLEAVRPTALYHNQWALSDFKLVKDMNQAVRKTPVVVSVCIMHRIC